MFGSRGRNHKTLLCMIPTKIDYFKFINKIATIHAMKKKLEQFQTKRKNNGQRGGVTANTYDVFFALLSCLPPTMADIQANQQERELQAIEDGEFFVMTYNKTIKTKINNLKDMEVLQIHSNTVKNHINLLLEAGVLTNKINHNKTGENPQKRGFQNPRPQDANPKGRGKIQLFFAKDVLFLTHQESLKIDSIRQTLSQYRTSSFLTSKLESIVDNSSQCAQAVSATADVKNICKKGKEQERIIPVNKQGFAAKFSTKTEYVLKMLFNLACSEFYSGREFNNTIQKSSESIIEGHLEMLRDFVQDYRSKKIKSYCQRPEYQQSTASKQMNKLKMYSRHLPDINQGAIEILSHAIQKQAKHAKKYNYIQKFGWPPDFLASPNFIKALNYSQTDWSRIQNQFFIKNINFGSYCQELKAIGKLYTLILAENSDSLAYGYRLMLDGYSRFQARMENSKNLTDSNKKTLSKIFYDRFSPLFTELKEKSKEQIRKTA